MCVERVGYVVNGGGGKGRLTLEIPAHFLVFTTLCQILNTTQGTQQKLNKYTLNE